MGTVVFVGGGTLGHITPALAVARALQRKHPTVPTHFLCSPRGEATFLAKEGLSYSIIDAPRLSFTFPWKAFKAYRCAAQMLRNLAPSVIFSKGGYLSVPVCLAARRLGIPIILHESDAVMGNANRVVSMLATRVLMGMSNGEYRIWNRAVHSIFPIPYSTFTGNPVRPEITQGSREEGRKITGLAGRRPILLVMGGSQGSSAINAWVIRHQQELTNLCDILHITGPGKSLPTKIQLPSSSYYSIELAHEELPHLYAMADLALSRAGAGSLSELGANGIASIIVPLRGVAHNHQCINAEVLRKRNACVVVTQDDMDKELMNVVKSLIENSMERARIGSEISKMEGRDASGHIVDILSGYLV